VVHRDLKPGNILVDQSGKAMVMDFGIARPVNGPSPDSQVTLGTPFYMAPEQIVGDFSQLDARTDVYALGIILYEILTGRLPYVGDSTAEIFRKVLDDDPDRPTSLKAWISSDIELICLKAMEKHPRFRYPTAEALANDLRRYLNGEPVEARPPSWVRTLWRRIQQHRGTAAIVLVVSLTLFGITLYIRDSRKEEHQQAVRSYVDQVSRLHLWVKEGRWEEALARLNVLDSEAPDDPAQY
jgi:serine/threonine-protein kinase